MPGRTGIAAPMLLLAGLGLAFATFGSQGAALREGVLIPVSGPIGPATSDFFVRELRSAQAAKVPLVVIRLDTPGGLETSMRDMIQAILAADVPVVAFVAPSGARAASAGTYLLYACHVAAMAPATNLGAATPVQIGGFGGGEEPRRPGPEPTAEDNPKQGDKDGGSAPDKDKNASHSKDSAAKPPRAPEPGTAMERKAVNDSVAFLRSLAELRGRNVEWAERAVREGASLPADEALEQNVIELVTPDLPSLLRALDGREVKLPARTVKLATAGLTLREVQADWRTELLQLITNPNVAYLLMLIGIYGLLLEGYHPGAVLPGVVGAICLLLAAYALQLLSVNYAGAALIALGVLLMIMEVFMPSFGSLGIGGVIAFVIGSIILLDTDVPGFGIPRAVIGSVAFVGGSLVFATAWLAVRVRQRPIVSGREHLLGNVAVAEGDFAERGHVRVQGELWDARTTRPVRAGEKLRIVAIDGLQLAVEPATEERK